MWSSMWSCVWGSCAFSCRMNTWSRWQSYTRRCVCCNVVRHVCFDVLMFIVSNFGCDDQSMRWKTVLERSGNFVNLSSANSLGHQSVQSEPTHPIRSKCCSAIYNVNSGYDCSPHCVSCVYSCMTRCTGYVASLHLQPRSWQLEFLCVHAWDAHWSTNVFYRCTGFYSQSGRTVGRPQNRYEHSIFTHTRHRNGSEGTFTFSATHTTLTTYAVLFHTYS